MSTETKTAEAEPQLPLAPPVEQQEGQGEQLAPADVAIEVEETPAARAPEQPKQPAPQEQEEEVVVDSAPTSPPGYVPRKHVPAKQRIGQLTAQMKSAQEQAAIERQGRERAEAAIEQWKLRVQTQERQSITMFGEQLKAQIEQAKNAISTAKAAGDEKAETDAFTKLAKLAADQSSVEAYLSRQPAQQPQQTQQQQPQRQQPGPQVKPEVQNWIKENSWFNANSPDFDPEMHQHAFAASVQLDSRYRRLGREDQIGSKEYLAEVDKAVRSEFPDAFEDEPQQAQQPLRMQAQGPGAAVAPRNGVLPAGYKQVGKQISVPLTAEEREVARSWTRTHADGRSWTEAEKERRFAELKYKQATGKSQGGVEINVNVRGSK